MFTKKDESTPLNTDFSQVKRDGHFYAAIEDNQCASATGKSHDDEEACISGTDEESNQQVPEAVGSIIAVLLLGMKRISIWSTQVSFHSIFLRQERLSRRVSFKCRYHVGVGSDWQDFV